MARELAQYLRRRYRLNDVPTTDDLIRCLEGEGAIYEGDWPLVGRVKALVFDHHVYTQAGLLRSERRAALAHELGHVLLDEGSQLHLLARGQDLVVSKQERRATIIAGWILLDGILGRRRYQTPEDLADAADVPLEWVLEWLSLVADRNSGRLPRGLASA